MERKVVQFQILPAKGKLWKYQNKYGSYDVGYWENMIVYLFSDGELQCEPVFYFYNLEPMDELDGYFIDYLTKYDFKLEHIQQDYDCTLEKAKEQIRELIKVSGIRCSDEVLEMLKD